jgi:DNA-binding protein HU-beta
MTKQEVIRRISQQNGTDPEVNQSVIETFFEVVKSAVTRGETIYVRTFGSFGPKRRAAKVARNIRQRTVMQVDAHTIPAFKPSPEFLNQVRQLNADPNQSA